MKQLLEGKRIFEEETEYGVRYLVLPSEKLQKYVDITGYFIKHGDFNKPVDWINTYGIKDVSTFIKIEEFNPELYEFMFYHDIGLPNELQKVLEPYGIDIQQDMNEFLKIEELPSDVIEPIKSLINAQESHMVYPEDFTFLEGYEFENDGEHFKFIIGEDYGYYSTDITYDVTEQFFDRYIIETYYKETSQGTEYVFKTDEGHWYRYYSGDSGNNYVVLVDIYREELVEFPFYEYTLLETEERSIPKRRERLDFDIALSQLIDKDSPYDFYYSEKAFSLQVLEEDKEKRLAFINGEWLTYTDRVSKGETPSNEWKDVQFIGSGTFGGTKKEEYTKEEMKRFMENIRANSKISLNENNLDCIT